ncbi:MAG: hypothetical protein V5804_13315, partial [Mucilaginibacter sp.]|uniref:hypothetical protein n=1 Tax=Mucilaginibacter sp. TaxID=1882438 RepID=UPI0034E532BA
FISSLTYLYKEFCLEYGIEENEELFIKIKVQSKGGMFLRGLGIAAVVSIAGILSLSDNTNVKLELGNLKVQGSSSGLIKTYSNFLDASQKRQIELQKFLDSRKKLDAKPVKDSVTKEQDTVDSNKIKNGVSLPPPKQ